MAAGENGSYLEAMRDYPDQFRVLYDGHEIGTVAVTERHPRKFFGRLVRGNGFENRRAPFDEVVRWARQVHDGSGAVDYEAWDRYVALVGEMTRHIELPEVSAVLKEFAFDDELAWR